MNIRHRLLPAVFTAATCLGSLHAQDPAHPEQPPGEEKSLKTHALEMGANLLQSDGPLHHIDAHLCGFHFYSGDIKRQVMSIHFCAGMNEEMRQCVIYDSDKADARLIGVEYIISERLFKTLAEEEKKLWHSHRYEVKSGVLFAPNVPNIAEKELMKQLVNTYGKTWHFWQVDRGDTLPLGVPQLMMGFTQDGQIHPDLLKKGEEYFKVSSEKLKANRADISASEIAPGADAWMKGAALQLKLETVPALSLIHI